MGLLSTLPRKRGDDHHLLQIVNICKQLYFRRQSHTVGGAFNLISSKISSGAPEISNTVSYVSNDVRGTTTTLSGGEDRVDVIARIKDSVVEISTAAGS